MEGKLVGESHTVETNICQAINGMAVIFRFVKRLEGIIVRIRDECGSEVSERKMK